MDYNLTKKDVEKLLNKSSKTISRYIKKGSLHPIKKKVDGYITYLFAIEDIEDFTRGQSGHEGQSTKGQGTNGGTFDTTPTPDNTDRVNNLHGGTQGTNGGTFESKKDTPEDTGDRTGDSKAFELLEKTLGMLQTTLDNQSKQIDTQSKQIENLTHTEQFLINEVSGFRKMLGLPTTREDILNGTKEGEVVDTSEGTKDRTQDKTPKTEGTKTTGHTVKKVTSKAKQSRGQRGQKDKTRGDKQPKTKTKPITSDKTAKPKESKKRFNFFKWITS